MRCPTCSGEGKWPTFFDICIVCNGNGALPDSRINNPRCPICGGIGKWPSFFSICEKCNGWGKLPGETIVSVSENRRSDRITFSLVSAPILDLIAQGESQTLEFKETLEYDIQQKLRVAGLAKASLKTIAAFLNTGGGILLIGVSDSGKVKGIASDLQFVRGNNCDGFEQKLRNLINEHFDPSPLGNIDIRFEALQEETICRINVDRSSEPIAYDKDFYVRDGNGTRRLEGRDLLDWLIQRKNS